VQSLDEIQADAFRCWSHGVADRRSAFRSPALVTVGPDGRPQVRTVVLRGFDPAARLLTVHSDIRAAKIAALQANPDAALHVWDDDAQVQVRVDGTVAISTNSGLARTEWARLHEGSRAAYRSKTVPATVVEDPAAIPQVDDAAAFAQFAVLHIRLDRMEWLHLAHEGQRRARFVWREGVLEQHWLAP
jgi:pyridoxine/pyridoxamine 5'-phosphate oxidase